MNSINNNENVSISSEITSESLLVSYDDFEVDYQPTKVWVVVPVSAKWSIDSSPYVLISDIDGSSIREDGKVEAMLDGNYLNGKTVNLRCVSSENHGEWTYLDINFPINDVNGNQLQTYSIGWNIKTIDNQ